MRKVTLDDLRSEIQASDQELELALQQKHILNIHGMLLKFFFFFFFSLEYDNS
jgi:hypothetical protein